jgi:hypothetical protein
LKDVAGRSILQNLGDEKRAIDPLYWVKLAFEKIESIDTPKTIWIITDVRLKNEAETIRSKGGSLWRVLRVTDDFKPFDNGLTSEQKQHASETALDACHFDQVILNQKLDQTKLAAFTAVSEYLAKLVHL